MKLINDAALTCRTNSSIQFRSDDSQDVTSFMTYVQKDQRYAQVLKSCKLSVVSTLKSRHRRLGLRLDPEKACWCFTSLTSPPQKSTQLQARPLVLLTLLFRYLQVILDRDSIGPWPTHDPQKNGHDVVAAGSLNLYSHVKQVSTTQIVGFGMFWGCFGMILGSLPPDLLRMNLSGEWNSKCLFQSFSKHTNN